MKTEEIVKLSRQAVVELIESRRADSDIQPFAGPERRRAQRWPFPGQVEVFLVNEDPSTPLYFECRDLSESGMGMCGDTYIPVGSLVDLSLHLPELTLYGRAIVRYSMETSRGNMMGVEFMFDA